MVRYSDVSQVLCNREEIDVEFHDRHIYYGYRKPNVTILESIKYSMLASCNEFFNIWSHGLTFVYFMVRFGSLFYYEHDLSDPMFLPLVCIQIGILSLFFMSTFAHTFNSMSKCARHKCFYLDYAGINIYSIGTGHAFYYYCRLLNSPAPLLDTPYLFLTLSTLVSVISTALMCSTRMKWCSSQFLVRTLSCALPFAVNSFPLFQRLYLCDPNNDDCDTTWLPIFYRHTLFLVLGALANVTKFPECHFPGLFDIFGQSHHSLHVFITLSCKTLYDFVLNEMYRRKHQLDMHEMKPNLINCLVVMILGTAINVIIALVFQCEEKAENYNDNNNNSVDDEKKEK